MSLLSKLLIIGGIAFIVVGLLVDVIGFGTGGGEFGYTQLGVILVGVAIIALTLILHVSSPSKRTKYALVLAIVLLLLWRFKLYPASWYRWDVFQPAPLSFRIFILSHISILGVSLVLLVVACHPIWVKLRTISLKLVGFSVALGILLFIVLAFIIELISAVLVPPWPARDARGQGA